MSFDIRAACIAAKKRLTRQLNKAVKQQQQEIAADFEQARAPVAFQLSSEQQRRLAMYEAKYWAKQEGGRP